MQEIERHDEKKHRSTFFGDPNKQPLPDRGEEIGDNRIHDTACVKISISDIFALLQHPAGKRGSKEKERKKERNHAVVDPVKRLIIFQRFQIS